MDSATESTQGAAAQPLVSIIMNCYNGARYLRQAMESVISQTYTNWELIFWDNQSTDESAAIFKSHDDPRLRYFYAPVHTFLYEARAYAIEQSRGQLIAFLDVDDWWDSDKLEKQMPLFDDPEVGLVCANYLLVREDRRVPPRRVMRRRPPKGRLIDELLEHYFVGLLTLVVRRTAYTQLDHGCDHRYHIIGDFDLVIRLSIRWKLDCVPEPLAYCRLHGDNETGRYRERSIKEMETWTAEMSMHPQVSNQQGFQTLLTSIRYDYGRLYVMQHKRFQAFREWWSLPWGMFKIKLLADILIPLSNLSWKIE